MWCPNLQIQPRHRLTYVGVCVTVTMWRTSGWLFGCYWRSANAFPTSLSGKPLASYHFFSWRNLVVAVTNFLACKTSNIIMCVPQIVSLGCIRLTAGVCIGGGVRIGTGSLLQFESQSLQPCRVHSLCPPSLLPPPPPPFPTPPDPQCHTLHLFNVLFYIQTLCFLHIQRPVDKHCFPP